MELLRDILAKALQSETIRVEIIGLDIAKTIETRLYRALNLIRSAMRSDMDDPDCFERVEQIIAALEESGSGGGDRHDF